MYETMPARNSGLFDLDGKPLGEITLPAIGTVAGVGGRWDRKEMFYGFQSFTIPASVYEVDLSFAQD